MKKHYIYKVTNKVNGKIYIGQTCDLKRRNYHHIYSSYNEKAGDYNTRFHQAIRKHGKDNFQTTLLCIAMSQQEADELETFYIEKFNSFDFSCGYNMTKGGISEVGNRVQKGEKNGRALLTKDDVYRIREDYNNLVPFREVFLKYQDKISKRGLQKVWYFETWKDVLPEVNTPENKYWHSHNAKANPSEVAANNKRHFSEEDVRQYRELHFEQGMSIKRIHEKFCSNLRYSTVYNMITKKTYKDIE